MTKKVVFIFIFCFSFGIVKSQEVCFSLFPNKQGTQLVIKGYDGKGVELGALEYTSVGSSQDVVNYVATDVKGKEMYKGKLAMNCEDGVLTSEFLNRQFLPMLAKKMKGDTKVVSSILDYPNAYGDQIGIKPNATLANGEISVLSPNGKKELLRLQISDRQYVRKTEITTPAGIFPTTNISYYVDVIENETVVNTFWVLEWYAEGAGIIRSETYNKLKQLVGYTELESIK